MSATIERMFESHPMPVDTDGGVTAACVEACFECVQVCTACADACLSEADPDLKKCIRLNLDCADVCDTTGRLLARASHTDAPMLRAQVEACRLACSACAEECAKHGKGMEHCAVCADACRRCEEACDAMAAAIVP